ncbi:toxin secretion/phage lysis holin [Bacillus cereus HuB4-4]|uniref:Toxin secretion/phage lysis holin n=1 Tax=Bacillus cereus HuB4-4 TaxID=1053211 RepID=A0A9W5VMD6_BACCE|nr:toxin secretion/phage lysis holin [Bacillus cereus HuB4-4]
MGIFLGGWDTTLQILVTLAVINYVTGIIAAGHNGELKSKVGFKGIAKKGVLFLMVGAATQADAAMGSNSAIRKLLIRQRYRSFLRIQRFKEMVGNTLSTNISIL